MGYATIDGRIFDGSGNPLNSYDSEKIVTADQISGQRSRTTVVKGIVRDIIQRYGDKFTWGIYTPLDSGLTTKNNHFAFVGKDTALTALDNYRANLSWGMGSFTKKYINLADSIRFDNTNYRCQKTFIVALTDGDGVGSCDLAPFTWTGAYTSRPYIGFYDTDGGAGPVDAASYPKGQSWQRWVDYYGRPDNELRNNSKYGPWNPDWCNDSNINNNCNVKAGSHGGLYLKQGVWDEGFLRPNWNYWGPIRSPNYQTYGGKCINYSTGARSLRYDTFWDRDVGLKFFSHKLGTKDIKTIGTDAFGVSFDGDPEKDCVQVNGEYVNPVCASSNGTRSPFKNQLVETYTIGIGQITTAEAAWKGLTSDAAAYLANGQCEVDDYNNPVCKSIAPANFQPISNADELAKKFDNILGRIVSKTSSQGSTVSYYGATAPSILGSNVPNMAASVFVNAQNWASQLRFFGINTSKTKDQNDQDNVSITVAEQFRQPNYQGRKTMVSTFADETNWKNGVYWSDNIPDSALNNAMFGIGIESKVEAESPCGANQGCKPANEVRDSIAASGAGEVGQVIANFKEATGTSTITIPLQAQKTGKYAVKVYYLSAPPRNMTLTVQNTSRTQIFSGTVSTGNWMSVGSVVAEANLRAGANSLIITSNGSTADKRTPDIDYVTLTYMGSDSSVRQSEWKDAVIPWATRVKNGTELNAVTPAYSQTYRVRPEAYNNLGDIIGSPVVSIGSLIGGKYPQFLLTGANDGMAHIFQYDASAAVQNYAPYRLALSYLPIAMEGRDGNTIAAKLTEISNAKYGKNHQYLMNGGIVARQVLGNNNVERDLFMVANMGQGGRGSFALNLKPLENSGSSDEWLQSVPLFETPKRSANTPEYTIGSPQVGVVSIAARKTDTNGLPSSPESYTSDLRYSAVISSGLPAFKADGKTWGTGLADTALYVYDILGKEVLSGQSTDKFTNNLIRKIAPAGSVSAGLSQPTLVDIDFDGVTDIAYAGDYAGNLFRFDLRGTPKTWSGVKIFSGNGQQPITSAPAVSRNKDGSYIVIFGTGSDIYENDKTNIDQQMVYGIFDDIKKFDEAKTKGTTITPVAYNSPDLLVQTVEGEQTVTNPQTQTQERLRIISRNKITPTHKGWVLKLDNDRYPGERVTVKPQMVLRTALITSHSYTKAWTEDQPFFPGNEDLCLPVKSVLETKATSVLMGIDARTGGAVETDKDGKLLDGAVSVKGWYTQNGYYYGGLVRDGMREMSYMGLDLDAIGDNGNGNPTGGDGNSGGTGDGNSNPNKPGLVTARTRDGDTGGSGVDLLSELGKQIIPNNECFGSGKGGFILSSGGEASPRVLQLVGSACKATGIRRLSWREIF